MGRLPEMWAGRKITMRVPYEMAAELQITSQQTGQQFPADVFLHNIDKPFEIHRVKPFVVALDANRVPLNPQPDQATMQSLLRVAINDFGKNEKMTKNATLLGLLVKGTAESTWEWAEPYTIERAEGFQVTVDALSFANFATVGALALGWIFEGFLLVIAPPSQSR